MERVYGTTDLGQLWISAFLGVRKVGINVVVGVAKFSSTQQEIEWHTWSGLGPFTALRIMSQIDLTGSQPATGADGNTSSISAGSAPGKSSSNAAPRPS